MSKFEKLTHVIWHCQYRMVWEYNTVVGTAVNSKVPLFLLPSQIIEYDI
ncbi:MULTISPECIES: hypothetical protein [unclassified Endozoicomonas]|nr:MULTISPECIES: hypothetical protein [unclassified Endozoicomonas]